MIQKYLKQIKIGLMFSLAYMGFSGDKLGVTNFRRQVTNGNLLSLALL